MAKGVRYVYGSAVPAYQPEPQRRRPEREPEQKPKQQPKRKIDKVAVTLFLLVLMLTCGVCFSYLQKCSEIDSLDQSIKRLQMEKVTLSEQIKKTKE